MSGTAPFIRIAQMQPGWFWNSRPIGVTNADEKAGFLTPTRLVEINAEASRLAQILSDMPVPGMQDWMFEVPRRGYN
jgi:hypothetical protein